MIQSHNIRVLIVEDDFLVGETVRGVLEDIGYQIIGRAMNGLQAVEMTQTLRPDIVLMDLQMPDMDGIDATRRIQENSPAPIVALTAYDTPELVEKASQAGVGAYLLKPPNGKELERAITIALARFDDMVELRRLNKELQDALDQVQTLSGLLPICSSCKKIRDEENHWQPLEVYIRDRSEAEFTHSLCPDCAKKLYPDYYKPEMSD